MRNRFGGYCYRCGAWVAPGDGHFERQGGEWLVQHASCAISHRGDDVGRQAALLNAKVRRFFVPVSGTSSGTNAQNGHEMLTNTTDNATMLAEQKADDSGK